MGQINFYAWCRGYAQSGSFDNSGSRRYRDFPISGGVVQTDELSFLVSSSIVDWSSGQTGYPKSDEYETYIPRLMMGIYDSTSPHGYNYNPMIGFEFNLDFSYSRCIYQYYGSPIWHRSLTSGNMRIGQTFTLPHKYKLKEISFYLRRKGGLTSGDLWCEIKKTHAGLPSGAVIASGSTSVSNVTLGSWINFKLTPTVDVEKDERIAAYLYIDGYCDSNNYIQFKENGQYWNGIMYPSGEVVESTDGGSSWGTYSQWDACFTLKGSPLLAVRPFIANDIKYPTESRIYAAPSEWAPTGTSSYKISLQSSKIEFYVDGVKKIDWDISDVTLDGGYKFGAGNTYNWDTFRIQLIDTATDTISVTEYVFPTGTIFSANTNGENIEQSPDSGEHSDKLDEYPTHDGYSTTIYLPSGSEYTPGGDGYQEIYDGIISGALLKYTDDTATVTDYRIYMTARHSGAGTLSYGQPVVYIDGTIGYSDGSWYTFYPSDWDTGWRAIPNNPSSNTAWKISELKRSKLGYLCTNSPSDEGSHYLTQLYGEVHINSTILDGAKISGAITYYSVTPLGRPVAVSNDGTNWTIYSDRTLNYALGWNYDYITGRKTAGSENLSKYGRHLYTVNEPLITTTEDAEALAQQYLDTYMSGIKVGSITINGRTNIDLESRFRLSGAHLNFNEVLEIASYTQRIDKNGFTTTINYGTEPYDIAKKVANLENEVYG